jgi:hypothetical protein
MGTGASAVDAAKGKDAGAITAGVQGLSAADKAVLSAALEAGAGGVSIATNLKLIGENEGRLHNLHLTVMTNKHGIYEARSMIEQNRASIAKNYSAAFVGNRQMANENTDAIFKNRTAILDALKVDGPVQENFRNSKYNESTIEYLENRSLLNNRVAKVNEKMSEANADLIAINEQILKSNEEIVSFNAQQVETNTQLLDGLQADTATPDANAARIASNRERISQLLERNAKYNADMDNKHSLIKKNRADIEENDKQIKERRKEILKNRETIMSNGAKVAELLLGGAPNIEELTAKLATLGDDERANLKAALSAGGAEGAAVTTNRKNISENEAKLHTLYLDVTSNKQQLYLIRAVIEENRALILKNYASAFIGNRQVANQNTDDIFKNRVAILDALKTEGLVQENFRNSKHNEASVDFLEHRSKLNNRVAKVNEMMAALNTKLIEINSAIMKSNEEVVSFNSQQIDTNKKLLEGILAEKATPEANAARIAENTKRIQVISDRNAKYEDKSAQMAAKALENRTKIEANAKVIEDRREQIVANCANIYANGQKVAQLLRS